VGNIRPAGLDFKAGHLLAEKGMRLSVFHGALLAAGNLPSAICYRRPRVALFTSGDELRPPGSTLGPGEIINSTPYAVSALIRAAGGVPEYLGCAKDSPEEIERFYRQAAGADIILPIGGASVGDYDFMRDRFVAAGGLRVFEKIAVKPGKPTWFGRLGPSRVLGLPGNPAAALVVTCLFLQALIARMTGDITPFAATMARTASDLPENGPRESYLRAACIGSDKDGAVVDIFASQDSSLLSAFTKCDVLIRRLPHAAAVRAGARVETVPIAGRYGRYT
jgi:molybdopterin molybdotransferase